MVSVTNNSRLSLPTPAPLCTLTSKNEFLSLALKDDMIHLGVCLAVWECPHHLVNLSLLGESPSNGQVILFAQVTADPVSVFAQIMLLFPNNLVTATIVVSNANVKISDHTQHIMRL